MQKNQLYKVRNKGRGAYWGKGAYYGEYGILIPMETCHG